MALKTGPRCFNCAGAIVEEAGLSAMLPVRRIFPTLRTNALTFKLFIYFEKKNIFVEFISALFVKPMASRALYKCRYISSFKLLTTEKPF